MTSLQNLSPILIYYHYCCTPASAGILCTSSFRKTYPCFPLSHCSFGKFVNGSHTGPRCYFWRGCSSSWVQVKNPKFHSSQKHESSDVFTVTLWWPSKRFWINSQDKRRKKKSKNKSFLVYGSPVLCTGFMHRSKKLRHRHLDQTYCHCAIENRTCWKRRKAPGWTGNVGS